MSISNSLNFARDVQGFNAFAPEISNTNVSATITSSTAESTTVPSTHQNWIAVFAYEFGSDVWVAINNTASNPVGETFASTNSVLTPAQLHVQSGDVISCFNNSATSQDVGISLYAVP